MKLLICLWTALLLIPAVLACSVEYSSGNNVKIYENIESWGEGSNCNLSIYKDGSLYTSVWMDVDGRAYSYDAGVLPKGYYTSGIECTDVHNNSYVGECKFVVDEGVIGFVEGETMSIYDWFFIVGFLGIVVFFFLKTYNLVRYYLEKGKDFLYGLHIVWLGFALSTLFWLLQLVVFILDYTQDLFLILSYLASALWVFTLILSAAENFAMFTKEVSEKQKKEWGNF